MHVIYNNKIVILRNVFIVYSIKVNKYYENEKNSIDLFFSTTIVCIMHTIILTKQYYIVLMRIFSEIYKIYIYFKVVCM